MVINKKYTILISALFKGGKRIILNEKPTYIGEKSLHISKKVYSTNINYKDIDEHHSHTEFAQDKKILKGIKNKSEKSYLLKYNKAQFNGLLNDIYILDIERKNNKLDKTNKERLQKRFKNCETIKSRMEEWFLENGYKKTLDKILKKESQTVKRKPRGVSKLSIKRYKKVFDEYLKLMKDDTTLDDEKLFDELSKIDYYNKPYAPATIKDILDKKKYLKEPTKEKV